MLVPRQKMKIFISSICGDGKVREKYNIARAGLKALIESTGIAEVYLFEDEGSSSVSAGNHYGWSLEESDVCIFLIDNKDGVHDGVQKEIDIANSHKIKSLYYFCDKYKKKMTPLQQSLMGASYAKSTVVHSFEEIIKKSAQDLVDDLMFVYRSYCKGKLSESPECIELPVNNITADLEPGPKVMITNTTISDIDKCKAYFSMLVHSFPYEITKTNSLDESCRSFLPVMFSNKSFCDFDLTSFLNVLKEKQDTDHHLVVSIRWKAIKAYFEGDLEACINNLKEALHIAKERHLPDWFIKDILIDLRNHIDFLGECTNVFPKNEAQEEITSSEQAIYYPLIDRFDKELNSDYMENTLKNEIRSPYTVTYGNNTRRYTDKIACIYIVAMFNGSLTHLITIYKRLKLLAFHLCHEYSDWNFRMLLLKCSVINYNSKEIDGITRKDENILGKMTPSDAKEIYDFASHSSIPYQRQISSFEALKIVGYFLDDEGFESVQKNTISEINTWLDTENACVALGSHIIDALKGISLRIDQNILADICCKFIERGYYRWLSEVSNLIADNIELDKLKPELATRLLKNIITIVQDENRRQHINRFERLLYTLRKQNKELTGELDEAIRSNLPSFYESIYKLETSANEGVDMPFFIMKCIEQINDDNERQGKNGEFFGCGNRPHITIKSIIGLSSIRFKNSVLDEAFIAACNTLLSNKQLIESKCDAIELLVFLCKRFPNLVKRNKKEVQQLINSRSTVESSHDSIMSNLTDSVLKFSSLFLYNCFGEDIWQPLVEMLPYFVDDIPAQIHACSSILQFLEADEQSVIPPNIEAVFLQQSLVWCNVKEIDIKWYAIRILFQLLRNPQNSQIVSNQLVKSMDTDNLYMKNSILRLASKAQNVEKTTYDYLLLKASVDNNFVVRMVYQDIIMANCINALKQ